MEGLTTIKQPQYRKISNAFKVERYLIMTLLFFCMVMETIILIVPALTIIRFFNDLIVVVLLLMTGVRMVNVLYKLNCKPVLYAIVGFAFLSLLSAIINLVPVQLIVWATRNNFRGILYVLIVAVYTTKHDVKNIFKILFYVQIVNLLLSVYQYFILGYSGDYVGGIFGYGNGAGVNTFNAMLMTYFLVSYVNKKEKFSRLIFIILSTLVIAVLAEEKMTFIFFIILLIVYLFVGGFSYKKLMIILLCVGGIVLGIYALYLISPESVDILIDFNTFVEYASASYDEGYMIPRIGAFEKINGLFFKGDVLKILFGYGFGNCESSTFSIFQSAFYNQYGHYNYRWFTHQWIILECGLLGLIAYIAIFVTMAISFIRRTKSLTGYAKILNITGIIMSIYCVVTVFYNATLKVDMCYIAYFSVAIGFVSLKKDKLVKVSGK